MECILGSRKGVNIPEYPQACLLLRQRMLRILFGISQDIDYIAASFMRASDVLAIKELLSEHQGIELKLSLKLKTRRV